MRRSLLGSNGGALRLCCCASGERRSKGKCGTGGLSVACWGFNCRAQARRGLAGQAVGDARRHAAVKFCNRSDYCSIDSVKTISLTASL